MKLLTREKFLSMEKVAGLHYDIVDSPQAVASGEQLCPPLKKSISVLIFFLN